MDHHQLSAVNKSRWIELFLGFMCTAFIFIAALYPIPWVSTYIKDMDYKIYDEIIRLNLRNYQHEPRVVIIDIDNRSILEQGRWPWPRDKMARLINWLKESGVVTFGMDIVMPEAELNYAEGIKQKLQTMEPDQLLPPIKQLDLLNLLDAIAPRIDADTIFSKTLLDHNVVLGFLFHNSPAPSKGILPPPLEYIVDGNISLNKIAIYAFASYISSLDLFMKASTIGGFVTNYQDKDGTIRRTLLLAKYDGKLYPSLALATAMNYLLATKATLHTSDGKLYGFSIDGTYIPTNLHGQSLIPFWGPPHTLDYYSATDILQGKVKAKEVEGAIAIIGSTITLLSDLHETPIAPSFPGVEMVGNIVQAIIGQQMPSEYDWYTTKGMLIFLGIGLLFACLLPFLSIIFKLIVSLVSLTAILLSSYYLFQLKNIYLPIAFLLTLVGLQFLINFAYSFILERLQKRKISQLFGQYVPEQYVKELIESPDQYSMEGQTRTMTVLFADIRSFTSISETLDATGVKHLLNTFFTPITEIIFNFRGTIDKYVGDMVVAFWSAPMEDSEHAAHAIMTSLTIFKKLPEINAKMVENDLPAVNIGIGLSTGLMNVGDMGSEFRRAYTVLGDTVNLGSRLQDLTKFYKVDVLVSDGTREGQDGFIFRPIDKVAVKGRSTALIIYEPICTVEEGTPALINELEQYKQALESYYSQNWEPAKTKFEELTTTNPDVYVYQMYLDRANEYLQTPPESSWEGVFVHHTK